MDVLFYSNIEMQMFVSDAKGDKCSSQHSHFDQ